MSFCSAKVAIIFDRAKSSSLRLLAIMLHAVLQTSRLEGATDE